jgi:ribosomal protein L37AE/L43A
MNYTYLIGWSKYDKWYYGVRYSKYAHPSDLWKTYFTSSQYVKEFREKHGEPDIIQIRKTFNDAKSAKDWENRVLKRMNVTSNNKWLNKTLSYGFPTRDISGNNNPMSDPKTRKKVAKTLGSVLKEKMQNMSNEERSHKYGKFGPDNGFYGKTHSAKSKSKISEKIKKSSCHNKVACEFCGRKISKVNLSRHIYACSNGKFGTKANANRTGLKFKKSK